ncbi:hypothetical protein [Methylorubrum extorquens]|uniref:hypothetical protein n=1 Tax=Methylorubrum extorquens TaxID=408 RepID=UPI000158FA0E|nr:MULTISPECIES: hypothetical protein [Methylorubrum]ABY32624.1 hypothetical protein Mext_4255 [Methylorubrum extorquens PA1]ARO53938.1 hypothetical protein B2G69_07090 [Methylorubrum zatmanii]
MKTLLIASAAFAAMILTGVTADARGGRGGGGVRGGGGFHGGGFQVGRAGGVRGGYRGGVAGGYRGGYGRYGYRTGIGAAAIGVGAAGAAAYGLSNSGSYSCGSHHYYDANSGACQPY